MSIIEFAANLLGVIMVLWDGFTSSHLLQMENAPQKGM